MSTTNPFASSAFTKGSANIQSRANASRTVNSNTSQQRMGLGDTSTAPTTNRLTNNAVNNVSTSDRQSMANLNDAIRNNPVFQTNVANNNRDFAEDTRRFNEGLSFKKTADQRANDTDRFRSSTQLEGVKYNADAGVKSTQIGADAQVASTRLQADASRYGADKSAQASMYGADKGYQASIYGADRQLDGVRLQTDASRYGADRGYQASIYNADRGVDQARIGADAQIRASEIGADASRFNALLGTGVGFFNSSGYRPTFNR